MVAQPVVCVVGSWVGCTMYDVRVEVTVCKVVCNAACIKIKQENVQR